MPVYKAYHDNELLDLLNREDHLAYTEIFNRYSAPLYAHAYNKLRNEDDAHDVVQEMFLKLWDKRARFGDGLTAGDERKINLAGYLFTGVRNAIFDMIRHRNVAAAYEESFLKFDTQHYPIADYLIREKQFAELIEKEIAALPPRMREVFELSRKDNLSYKEIALKMNIAESTVADQMKKALKILRPKIGMMMIAYYLLNQ
ncbi:RNA polymerase sigma-70 factor, ECF subfamily [Mucilaginibacter pineti]|uniref:RNA polymerase sigma-70 factor, ECF subfamily n=2 Tax=Mucilaginibacter pineti TaxID=1391627 RepID=A0A1G7CQZ6_9SPHI|nr:RNA polymerase sigma-70 factor, ECF subfamily [Mucilaginibacter pineti]